jgi:hypothetical protein
MPVISHPARHNRAAKASGFWLLWLWLLWLGPDLMAVVIISPLLASAPPAAKISKPAVQKSTAEHTQHTHSNSNSATALATSNNSNGTAGTRCALTQAPSTSTSAKARSRRSPLKENGRSTGSRPSTSHGRSYTKGHGPQSSHGTNWGSSGPSKQRATPKHSRSI